MSIAKRIAVFIIVGVVLIDGAPTNTTQEQPSSVKPPSSYDLSNFHEVYDQRQNGTENYRLNVDGVAIILTPPQGLLDAVATIALNTGLNFGDDYADLEEFFITNHHGSSSTSTTSTPSTTEANKPLVSSQSTEKVETSSQAPVGATKRRFRIPEFIKPFMKRRREN